MKKYLLPLILILCLSFGINAFGADLFGTYDQRIKLTIDNTKVDSDLTWFPVMIKLTSGQMEEVFAEFDSDDDFDRCAITLADESTQIYGDCERFDDSESVAEYHVAKTGVVTDADAAGYLYFYYDKDAAHNTTYISKSGDTAGESVYDGDFEAVYHMVGTGENAIDVGNGAVDRTNVLSGNVTYIDLANPADYTGKITSVQIWAAVSMASAKVATFSVSGGNYTARSVSAALGGVLLGDVRTFNVSLDVVAGDFIGIYFTDAADSIEAATSGGSGVVYLAGDQTACTDETFALHADHIISLYGTGVEINIIDSTSNDNDGTKKAANQPVEAVSKVGLGQDFTSTHSIVLPNEADFDINYGDPLTVECIIYRDTITHTEYFISKVDSSSPWPGWEMISGSSAGNYDDLWVQILNTDTTKHIRIKVANVVPATTWAHIGFTYSGSGAASGVKIYVNGVLQENTVLIDNLTTNNPVSTNPVYLGARDNPVGNFVGIMDEPRIHMAERTAGWMKATYNSLYDTLLTYGNEESAPVGINVIQFGANF